MKNWTIGKRIIAGFAIVLAVTGAMGIFAYTRLQTIQAQSNRITLDCLPGVYYIGEVKANLARNLAFLHDYLGAKTAEVRAQVEATLKTHSEHNTELCANYEKTITLPRDRELFEEMMRIQGEYRGIRTEIFRLVNDKKEQEAHALFEQRLEPAFGRYDAAIQALVDFNKSNGDDAAAQITAAVNASRRGIVLALVLALMAGCGVAFGIIRGTGSVLRSVASTLRESSTQVTAAAGQVSAASQSLAEGASQQAASLEETSSSLEEMASMTRRNAENAQRANELAKHARTAADRGATDMQAMSHAMEEIKTSSDDIAKIIKTIDEIAFQTNILALNAAVEAARAGEAGMGFAVVADEVRSLAQRSAQAAKETAGKIEAAIGKTTQGVHISQRVGQGLQEIVERVRQVDQLVAEVSAASTEQSQGIEQVNKAVTQMDKVTQANAANAEETASAAEELNAQAEAMKDAVTDLLHLVTRAKVASRAASASTPPSFAARPLPSKPISEPAPAKTPPTRSGNGTAPRSQLAAAAPEHAREQVVDFLGS